jgi:high-affinity iron transporter
MKRFACTLLAGIAFAMAATGVLAQDPAQMLVHLLDYIGVDYAGAVEGGKVRSEDEYKEMLEFSAQVQERLRALPANPRRQELTAEAARLAALVRAKASEASVAEQATKVRWMLIQAYALAVAPKKTPDLGAASRLYAAQCAGCHGAEGRGDGPAAKGLDPKPADFHDAARMASRSIYGLYNTISLGVSGTSMAAFEELSEDDRWALAFYVASLSVPAARVKEGQALWRSWQPGTPAREAFRDYTQLATLSAAEIKARYGDPAVLVQDYLRAHPEAIAAAKPDPIQLARARLGDALRAYERGDAAVARELAISAYLDGFELAESSLDNVDRELRFEIERSMMGVRSAIASGAPGAELRRDIQRTDALLERAAERMAEGSLSETTAFASSFAILLREGMEGILILAALIAFVVKTGRRDALPWLHAGWMAALALGAVTWFAATYMIGISGASREMTEGVTALVAAGMLLYVGYWLHGKTQSRAWSRFLRQQVDSALERKTLWAMASVSFLAVYRELFEVVLFYQALWAQAGETGQRAVLGGIAAAALVLGAAGWAIFKYSVRLPLAPFFTAMLWLVLLIAFIFAGQGVAALQEAGAISANPVNFVALPLLGIHPTVETLGAQIVVLAVVAISYWLMRERQPAA